ncbi:MAG TPA: HlyD family efflux transporter periplasmic adaptor subunit [Sphingomicrobium sp.]|jgi:HlyD family secretion protein
MSRARPIVIAVVIIAAALVAWRLLASPKEGSYLSGYVVSDNLDMAAPVSGTVESVAVTDGQRVTPGQALFRIAPATLEAQGQQASANISATVTQIATAQANLTQALANVTANAAAAERARSDLARLEAVRRDDPAAVAGKDLDAARAAYREAQAAVVAARKAADARRAEIGAAQAQTRQAEGGKRSVDIQMAQLSPSAPAAGRVSQVYYQQGEWVAANQPVVSIIPDAKVKLRFFVPEKAVAKYQPGKTVRFSCDGCAQGLSGRIRYVSPDPEFTPPVIFSRESRDRMVFMVEALVANGGKLNPGQPVEVVPLP